MALLLSSCSTSQIKDLNDEIDSLKTELAQVKTENISILQELQEAKNSLEAINAFGPNRLEALCSVTQDSKTICRFYSLNLELRFAFDLPDHFRVVELMITDDQGTSRFSNVLGLWYQNANESEMIVMFTVLPKATTEDELLVRVFNLSSTQALFASIDLDTQLSTEAREEIVAFLSTHYGVSGALDADWDFRLP